MSALRSWTLGVLAFGLLLARCDFGIDTKGLVGDGQAPLDATSEASANDAESEAAPPADASEAAPPIDATAADAGDGTDATTD